MIRPAHYITGHPHAALRREPTPLPPIGEVLVIVVLLDPQNFPDLS
jgi:hypothetical protein